MLRAPYRTHEIAEEITVCETDPCMATYDCVNEVESPEARSIEHECMRRKLDEVAAAALRRTQAVYHGTVKGARIHSLILRQRVLT